MGMMYFDLTEEERRKALDICDDIKRQCDEILELLRVIREGEVEQTNSK